MDYQLTKITVLSSEKQDKSYMSFAKEIGPDIYLESSDDKRLIDKQMKNRRS